MQNNNREELDRLINSHSSEKDEQRRADEQLRDRFKQDFERFQENEKINKMSVRYVASNMAEQSLQDYRNKLEKEV